MRRGREARMARLTAHATAADSAAAWQTLALEARAAIGTALRQALSELAIDPAAVPMLRVSDEAAQELRIAGNGPKTDAAASALAGDQRHEAATEAFATRIEGLAQRYYDGQEIDFTHASLAEMLAWCLARCKANN
jgi:hypothetical protein